MSDAAAVDVAIAHLDEHRVENWTDLTLQARLTHEDPRTVTHTFTYWHDTDAGCCE
ncbi:hypothetical protein [Prescottella equi]|uniref:Uncharacterized protein n=1 Tax=Rhodococcus hoagii (strain 103S) TaxID=685727 RepID=A0A3S5YDB2_RHOH1|nr:hypothetical protein [Prescottella equi]MBM4694006.1 hypothetical protein [Prescottella equi]MBM4733389.1 hypothetical protein [Prescottella equi]NKZ65283.1 hypothetical protein [Prescottella equi]NKZ76751.1 hypothetical protein [Prescottella equi]CBH50571.1 hypothetical protein REQ_46200 [Prescottella equi 103S]